MKKDLYTMIAEVERTMKRMMGSKLVGPNVRTAKEYGKNERITRAYFLLLEAKNQIEHETMNR